MANNESIRVIIRVRPLNEKEQIETGGKKCLYADLQQNTIILDTKPEPKTFKFDFIGDTDINQEQMFQIIAQPIAVSCLSGYNGTIFAYGQTGAGKTYTIHGPGLEQPRYDSSDHQRRGLLPRSLEFIFNSIHREMAKCKEVEYLIKCSFLEIYQEQVRDLLSAAESGPLQLREDIKRGVYVEGLLEEEINNTESAYEFLRKGVRNRHIGATSMNLESSRSHAIFTLIIQSKERKDDLLNVKFARFHLVDLAGSERQKLTDSSGERLKEAGMINKSLSALGNVINSLVDIGEGKSRFIHYRDSKLTFILKDSLGGNSKTCIVANVNPANLCFNETLSTLKFAQRAKQIKTKAVVNEDVSGGLEMLKEEVARLRQDLAKAKIQPCLKCNYNQLEQQEAQTSDYSLLILNDKLAEMEELLHKEQLIRMNLQNQNEEEVKKLYEQQQNLQNTVSYYEQKMTNDKMLIKIKEGQINRFKQNTVFKYANSEEYVKELQEEIEKLKENYEQHPVASKLFYENQELKQIIYKLEDELYQRPSNTSKNMKEFQEYNKKLNEMLKQSFQERQQIKCIAQEYINWKNSQQNQQSNLQSPNQNQSISSQSPMYKHHYGYSASPVRRSLQSYTYASPSKSIQLITPPTKQFLIQQSPVKSQLFQLEHNQEEEQNQILLQQLQLLQQEKDLLQQERVNLLNQNKELTEKVQDTQQMQDKIYQENEKYLETADKLRTTQEDLETLQDSYHYLENIQEDLRRQNTNKNNELQMQQNKIKEFQAVINQKENLLSNLMDNQETTQQLEEKQQEILEIKRLSQVWENKYQECYNNLNEQSQQLSKISLEKQKIQIDIKEAQDEVSKYKQEYQQTSEELQKIKDENQFLNFELNKINLKSNELNSQLQLLQKEKEDTLLTMGMELDIQIQEQSTIRQQMEEIKKCHDQEIQFLSKQNQSKIQELKQQLGQNLQKKLQELKLQMNQQQTEIKPSLEQLQTYVNSNMNDIVHQMLLNEQKQREKLENQKQELKDSYLKQIQTQSAYIQQLKVDYQTQIQQMQNQFDQQSQVINIQTQEIEENKIYYEQIIKKNQEDFKIQISKEKQLTQVKLQQQNQDRYNQFQKLEEQLQNLEKEVINKENLLKMSEANIEQISNHYKAQIKQMQETSELQRHISMQQIEESSKQLS